jgi:hypothetical protein
MSPIGDGSDSTDSRGVAIGGDAKAVRLLLLEQVRHLAQLAGYGVVEGVRHVGRDHQRDQCLPALAALP